jgi:hypothetical protein
MILYQGSYYTPQVKRKRIENQATCPAEDPFREELSLLRLMLTEANQKIDFMHKKQETLEKKVDHVQKDIGGISRHVIKVIKNISVKIFISLNHFRA